MVQLFVKGVGLKKPSEFARSLSLTDFKLRFNAYKKPKIMVDILRFILIVIGHANSLLY